MTTDAADVLYPSATPVTETPAATTATDEPAQSGPAITDTSTFYPNMYNAELKNGLEKLLDEGATPADVEAIGKDLSESFHAVGATPPQARILLSELRNAVKSPASPEQRNEWATETRRELRHRFGPDAAARLKHASSVVARSPALQQALNESGLGNRLDIVEMFIDRSSR